VTCALRDKFSVTVSRLGGGRYWVPVGRATTFGDVRAASERPDDRDDSSSIPAALFAGLSPVVFFYMLFNAESG
jgi:hypothetical protein